MFAILKGNLVVAVDTSSPERLLEWSKWLETENRRVAKDEVGHFVVSTVFLGVNHQSNDGPPIWFETMVFNTSNSDDKWV